MSQTTTNPEPLPPPTPKEWTLMFYFASDNPLAPSIVSQLKAIKNAGFHQDVNVVAQFDPQVNGTPTHIFDVNGVNKQIWRQKYPNEPEKQNYIGFRGDDPEVRNLVLDKLWGSETNSEGKEIKERVKEALREPGEDVIAIDYQAPVLPVHEEEGSTARGVGAQRNGDGSGPNEPDPKKSLGRFLEVCAKTFPARHYMLFILGHGVVVGNDIFLFDEHAERQSLKLEDLGVILDEFNGQIVDAELELIGLHSCSMSSAEVVYQLQGKANYMLASQGPAFVGSWPYREMLIRVFLNQQNGTSPAAVAKTINQIFEAILYTSFDFQLAGYSFDVCLINLKRHLKQLTKALDGLCESLIKALKDENPIARHLILLAHLEAQSFYQETYIDLFDFCACLKRRCTETLPYSNGASAILAELKLRCRAVRLALKKRVGDDPQQTVVAGATDDKVVLRAKFVGPESQYTHGLSVFFPWAEPEDTFWKVEYEKYAFHFEGKSARRNSWLNFLKTYFERTMRDPIRAEQKVEAKEKDEVMMPKEPGIVEEVLEEVTFKMFETRQRGGLAETLGPGDKAGGDSVMGVDSRSTVLKNYPSFTRERKKRAAKPLKPIVEPPEAAAVRPPTARIA